MRASDFDEIAFFRSLQNSGARALLIGRRALVLLGLPILTADYDFWLAIDDIGRFNDATAPFGLHPTRTAEDARRSGRYALENDEHIDVLVARAVPTADGRLVEFDALWQRRRAVPLGPDVFVQMPTIADLILTKRIAARPKDLEDIRLLEILQQQQEEDE
jgi:hypothetical protein